MNSKKSGLIIVNEAAHRLLRFIHLMQDRFANVPNPIPPEWKTGKCPLKFTPPEHLIIFFETHRAALEMKAAFTEPLRWELAGLSSPRGIRAGAGIFPSAHEVIAEVGTMVVPHLEHLLVDDAFVERIGAKLSWDAGRYLLSRVASQRYWKFWITHFSLCLDVLSETMAVLRYVRVLHLRGVLDCEYALARRVVQPKKAVLDYPTTRLSQESVSDSRVPSLTGTISFSPSSQPNVLRLLRAVRYLQENRATKEPLSIMGVYRKANLRGESQGRAYKAATRLACIDRTLTLLPFGDQLLAEASQVPASQ